jgi:hypothetical protein
MSSKTLVAMKRPDGAVVDSEVHFEGHVVKPDQNGVVLIPSEFVVSMFLAGYVHTTPTT